jgi:hypothetical protein
MDTTKLGSVPFNWVVNWAKEVQLSVSELMLMVDGFLLLWPRFAI